MIGSFATRAALTALLVVVGPVAARAADRVVDYLYIDANEGGSSGGHAALRVGEDVFHFEYRRPGMLVLRRETFEEFRREYAGLENRTIEVRRIPVAEAAFRVVQERFRRRYFVQQRQLDVRDTLRAERRILEEIVQGAVELEGPGFFVGEVGAADPTLLALRQRVVDRYGPDVLHERADTLQRRLAALDPRAEAARTSALALDDTPAPVYAFSRRYRDILTALAAIEVLDSARSLLPQTTITAASVELRLRDEEARMLTSLSERLATSLVRLFDSSRPDWGYPLLLGMARLVALEHTRASGQWVFLDAIPRAGVIIDRARITKRPELVGALLRDAGAELDAARVRLVSRVRTEGGFDERDFADLEAAGNRFVEIRRALDEGRDLRMADPRVPPAGRGRRPALLAPSSADILTGLATARQREEAYGHALERRYRYHIVTHNCVSEIFRELDVALLGERIETDASVSFIPALSTFAVGKRYGVSEVHRIPSYRRVRLAELYRREHPLRVFLRESNTITSTLYRRNPRDSTFLFFTDDAVVTRPLFGAANLLTGVGTSLAGLGTAPFDGGQLLQAGVRGAIFSLPELLFQNIRKGSFEYLGRAATELDDR